MASNKEYRNSRREEEYKQLISQEQDNNIIKCKSCGKLLRQITNTHLLKCCGLTVAEYCIKYNLDPADLMGKGVIKNRLDSFKNIDYDARAIEVKKAYAKKHEAYIITPEIEQIVLGSLLGDGYIFRGKDHLNSTNLIIEHGIRQLDYLIWKGLKLGTLEAKLNQAYHYNTVVSRYTTKNILTTRSLTYFGTLSKTWYSTGGPKILDKDMCKKLGPLGLAIWLMDDASSRLGVGRHMDIYTQSFTEEENNFLIDVLKTNFNLNFYIVKDQQDRCILRTTGEGVDKVISIVKDYFCDSMCYKISTIETPEVVIGRTFKIDASHFLTDHPARCLGLHGHEYQIEIICKGPIDLETGMLMDYQYIKKVFMHSIDNIFDHSCLNFKHENFRWRPTAEIMSVVFWKILIEFLPNLHMIKIKETSDTWCSYQGPSLDALKTKEIEDNLFNWIARNEAYRQNLKHQIINLFDINKKNYIHYKEALKDA